MGRRPKPDVYDVNDERIDRINYLLDRVPKVQQRIDQINALLYAGRISANEFHSLALERSTLVKRYDDMQRELKETFRIENDDPRGPASINLADVD